MRKQHIGWDYLIPLWGYLRYITPRLIKHKNYVSLFENTFLYFVVGIILAWNPFHAHFQPWQYGVLLVLGILEGLFYAKGGQYLLKKFGVLSKKTKVVTGKMGFLSYALIQMHALAFLVVGFIITVFVQIVI